MRIEKNKILYKTLNILFPSNLADVICDDKLKKKYSRVSVNSYDDQADTNGYEKRKKKTQIIKLKNKKIEEVLADFNSQTKNKINRSFKNDELKFLVLDENFEENYKIYSEIEYFQGRIPESRKYFDRVVFFSGYHRGELLSSVGLVNIDNKILRVINISSKRLEASDKEKYKLISIASRRVVYEICKYGVENGFEVFDFCGINFDDPKKKGITDFKLGFGGETVNEYIYVYKRGMAKYAGIMFEVKRVILKILKRK